MSKFNPRITVRERGLIKGALRRVFSRSELRRSVLEKSHIEYHDPERPRVTKWSECPSCNTKTPSYLMQVDHISPIISLSSSFEEMGADAFIDAMWCELDNMIAICKECHLAKSKTEAKERRRIKKLQKSK